MAVGNLPTVDLDPALLDWLLDVDPTLRWQVERDLVRAPVEVWRATRARIATEFGARLLVLQDPDGQWAGGAYFPSDFDFRGPEAAESAGQPWTATTWTLNMLREWGSMPPPSLAQPTCSPRTAAGNTTTCRTGAVRLDCCINAYTLANGAWLGADVSGIARGAFLNHRLADGGWNCDWVEGSTRSSFHSTLNPRGACCTTRPPGRR